MADDNKGFTKRQGLITGSKPFSLFGRPDLDLAFQERLILNGVDIKMKWYTISNNTKGPCPSLNPCLTKSVRNLSKSVSL